MQTLYATQVASISELKKNPTKLINDAHGMPVVILNHNVAAAYLIPVETFEKLMDAVDDNELKNIWLLPWGSETKIKSMNQPKIGKNFNE